MPAIRPSQKEGSRPLRDTARTRFAVGHLEPPLFCGIVSRLFESNQRNVLLRNAAHPPARRRAARTTTPSSSRPGTSTGCMQCPPRPELRKRSGQLWMVMLTPELYALPTELKASDNKVYEPLGTVVVFQLSSHP